MPTFSKSSLEALQTCDERLQNLMHRVIRVADITIIEGHRPKVRQNRMVEQGKSQLKWPSSYHNAEPSLAVDVAVWTGNGIAWNDKDRWERLHQIIRSVAASTMDVGIILGADWDMDLSETDHSFVDWPHVQLDVDYTPKDKYDESAAAT